MYVGTIAGRRLAVVYVSFIFNYQHYFPLLPITLIVAWELLLVYYNAKVIQLPYGNAF